MIELLGKNIFIDNDFEIKEYYTEFGNVRVLLNNNAIFSSSFIDEKTRYDLCDYYMSFYDIPCLLLPEGKDYLVLGGGAFSYPKYYISHYDNKNMTVVENDERCIKIAKEYFYLNELIEKYDSEEKRFKIILKDAIDYLNDCNDKFDYILIDLFNGKRPLKEMFLNKNLNNLKKILNFNGIVVVNYVVSDENFVVYRDEIGNLINSFKYFKIITNNNYYNANTKMGNLLIFLSNDKFDIPNHYDYVVIDNYF